MKLWLQLSMLIACANLFVPTFMLCAQEVVRDASVQIDEAAMDSQEGVIRSTITADAKAIDPESTPESKLVIQRKREEILLLKKLIRELQEPQVGVDELIRQEKMRLLVEKVNRNLGIIEKTRQEQSKQMQIIEDQRTILNQQRNLPKR